MDLHVSIIGDIFHDLTVVAPSLLSEPDTDTLLEKPIHNSPGGSGLNFVTHFSSHLAHPSTARPPTLAFYSALGSDNYGAQASAHLASLPLTFSNCNPTNAPTGHCMVVSSSNSADRSFYTYRGAMSVFEPDLTLPTIDVQHHLHITGVMNYPHLLTGDPSPILYHLANSCSTSSLVPQQDATTSHYPLLRPLFPHLTYLILSTSEARAIACDEPFAAYFTTTASPRFTVITNGAQGSTLYERSSSGASSSDAHAATPYHHPATPTPVLDATGAGDAFAAGFLATILQSPHPPTRKNLHAAMATATLFGAACCNNIGASTPLSLPPLSLTPLPPPVPTIPRPTIPRPTNLHAVFDFDRTLAAIEVGQFDLTSSSLPQRVARVFGSAGRLSMLVEFLRELKGRGVRLSVLSYNSSHIIRKAFTYCEPEFLKLFGAIKGFEDVATNQIGMPVSKGESLGAMIGRGERVIFVDDSSRNIRDVNAALPKVRTVWVDLGGGEDGGMEEEHVEEVLRWSDALHN